MSTFYNLEERTIGYALRVVPPKPVIPNKGFIECCYKNIVFGDETSNEDYNNDYYGVYFKKQISTDTCGFVLVDELANEYPLNNDTHGRFVDFNNGF